MVSSKDFGPSAGVHGAMLSEGHSVLAQHIRVDVVAVEVGGAEIDATLSVESGIEVLLDAEVGVLVMAVKRCLDSSAIEVGFGCVTRNDGHGTVDILDVGVGTGHDDMELLLELAVVHGHVRSDGTPPQITLDECGGGRVGATGTRIERGRTLEEDVEGVAPNGGVACGRT
jgi:hypothetical protein